MPVYRQIARIMLIYPIYGGQKERILSKLELEIVPIKNLSIPMKYPGKLKHLQQGFVLGYWLMEEYAHQSTDQHFFQDQLTHFAIHFQKL